MMMRLISWAWYSGYPVFAHENIKYHGEPIAAVAATTVEQAKSAAKEILVKIKPKPILTMVKHCP